MVAKSSVEYVYLTHWGRVTHICVGDLTIIGSDNGLSPGRRQAIIWINEGILLIGPLGTNFSESLIEILTFSFKKMCLKVSSAKWRPFCFGLNVISSEVHAALGLACLAFFANNAYQNARFKYKGWPVIFHDWMRYWYLCKMCVKSTAYCNIKSNQTKQKKTVPEISKCKIQ